MQKATGLERGILGLWNFFVSLIRSTTKSMAHLIMTIVIPLATKCFLAQWKADTNRGLSTAHNLG